MAQPASTQAAPFDPKILLDLTPEQVYDAIMREIEPDLTTDRQPQLEQLYAGETPEQATERFERYARAYEEYDRRYAAYKEARAHGMHVFLRGTMRDVEHDDRSSDDASLETLASSIATA